MLSLIFPSFWGGIKESSGFTQRGDGTEKRSSEGGKREERARSRAINRPPFDCSTAVEKKLPLNNTPSPTSTTQQQASPNDDDPSIGALFVSAASGTLTYWPDLSDATLEPRVASLRLGGRVAKVAAVAAVSAAGESDSGDGNDLLLSFVSVIARDDGALFRVDRRQQRHVRG